MEVIVTIPPYAPFIGEVALHPVVSGLRLNTVMPVREPLVDLLSKLLGSAGKTDLWIDLKCRQIRISYGYFFNEPEGIRHYSINGTLHVLDPSRPKAQGQLKTPPWAEVTIDRKITLDLSKGPVKCWFQDGTQSAWIADILDGNRLITLDGPQRVVGGGESINILDPSLEVEGFFTDLDRRYIEASKAVGLHRYMLSFVESDSDIEEILALDPEAVIIAKIESQKGLRWAAEGYRRYSDKVRLMAARGDLYTEVGRPDKILEALKVIIKADSHAYAASRILGSLRAGARPSCADITDLGYLYERGYHRFLLGDDICFHKDILLLALDIINSAGSDCER
ncbi:MAG: pyruvate kinase [Vulcanimicrobiota bacterium]